MISMTKQMLMNFEQLRVLYILEEHVKVLSVGMFNSYLTGVFELRDTF